MSLTQLTERARVPRAQVFRAHPPHPLSFQLQFSGSALDTLADCWAEFRGQPARFRSAAPVGYIASVNFLAATWGCDCQRRRVLPPAGKPDLCPGWVHGLMTAVWSAVRTRVIFSCKRDCLEIFTAESSCRHLQALAGTYRQIATGPVRVQYGCSVLQAVAGTPK